MSLFMFTNTVIQCLITKILSMKKLPGTLQHLDFVHLNVLISLTVSVS